MKHLLTTLLILLLPLGALGVNIEDMTNAGGLGTADKLVISRAGVGTYNPFQLVGGTLYHSIGTHTLTLTNKTVDGDDNTLLDIPTSAALLATGTGTYFATSHIAGASGYIAGWGGSGDLASSGILPANVMQLTSVQTATNKTFTSPVLNTGVSGTAFLDDDSFASATATTFASAESVKAYVDAATLGVVTPAALPANGLLTGNNSYYEDSLGTADTWTLEAGATEGEEIWIHAISTANTTITWAGGSTQPYRAGSSGQITTMNLPAGNHSIKATLSNSNWRLADSGVDEELANLIYASPNASGGEPTFRALVAGDISTGMIGADAIATTTVTAGSYTLTNLTVDADGRITAASNGTGSGVVEWAVPLTIQNPAVNDDYTIAVAPYDLTLTTANLVLDNGLTTWTADLRFGGQRDGTGTAVWTTPTATTQQGTPRSITTFNNATIQAGDVIWVECDAVGTTGAGGAFIQAIGTKNE